MYKRQEHGNDLRVLRQFGGKEDNGDEYEQRTEHIGEVGYEVHVVFKDDLVPMGFMLHPVSYTHLDVYKRQMYDAVLDADVLMLITEWKEFRLPSWAVIKKTMNQQIVLMEY